MDHAHRRNEERRLQALLSYEVLDTPPEEDLDRLARLGARIFRAPIALISLLDEHRQFFKARVGMATAQTRRDISFCRHAIESDEVMVVPDASRDPRFAGNPLVTGQPHIRFYAGAPLRTPEGERIGTFCVIDDQPREFSACDSEILRELSALSMDRLALRRLQSEASRGPERLQRLAASSPDGMLCTDAQGRITFANAALCRIFGYDGQALLGSGFEMLIPEEGRERYRRALLRVAAGGTPTMVGRTVEQVGQRADGTVFPLELSLSMWRENGQAHFGGIIRDLSQRRALEQRLFRLAHLDPLTELANREAFGQRLDHLLAHEAQLALLLVDLDNFKEVNDDHGHHTGDLVLRQVGHRLREIFPAPAMVARLGGDEFAVLLPQPPSRQRLSERAQQAIQAIALPIEVGPLRLKVGASIGAALHPWHGSTSELLMGNADLALYKAKKEGRNILRFFVSELRDALLQRRKLEAELNQAYEQGQFELYYQPQVSLRSREVVSCEALLRWRHPVRGLQTPAQFLDVLEASPLALPVGIWILRTACSQAARWRAMRPDFRISVNLFGAQVQDGRLSRLVQDVLAETGLDPQGLELEITENTLIHQSSEFLGALERIQATGVGIALDDYGTGYASLSLLKRLPVTRLKIDRSFVHDATHNKEDAAVVRAILYLGRNFGLNVVAEGVETLSHEAFLRRRGCDHAQGYLYGRPQSAAQFEQRYLGSRHPAEPAQAGAPAPGGQAPS
ncbi:EAL domain-containing protein [Orrella sp. JC864]|uniref:putative bifunctional diguanylate cyclase/phosphodiesterase n=1 Tax=Orrella sp. JC864 TaxID=3120298 RepID=UPI0012BCEECB